MATAATSPAFRQTPPSLATPPAVGTPIPEDFLLNNTWVLGKILGTGSYATVRMAQHRTTGQLAVCKTTTVKASDNTKDMEIQRIRLQREVACLLHLDGHPNIVRIYDVVADLPNDTVHIVMEHVEGEELYEFLKKCPDRRAGEAKVREITKQVLNAFVYMHEKKTVLHRDIKLDNIMVTKEGLVKLIDFNLSTMFSTDPSRKLTESVGCIHYASPQILEAAHRIPYSASNGWSDVWSFGVVVFALLQGVFPFKELTPTKLHAEIQKRGGRNLTFPVPISWEAKAFITDVLDPYRRWSARELLNHPFVVGVNGAIWDSQATVANGMQRSRTASNGSSGSASSPGVGALTPGLSTPALEFPQPTLQRPRFQIPIDRNTAPQHPSLAMLKEQLPAPRTPNAAMDISQMVNQGNYFAIQPFPTPSISQTQQSQLQYFDQPRNGLAMPSVATPGGFYPNGAGAFKPSSPQPLASPAAPPFRGLQWNAHKRSRAEEVGYPAPAPASSEEQNPEAMAIDGLLRLDPASSHQMVPTPPATPSNMIDYMSPSPQEQPNGNPMLSPPALQPGAYPTPSTPGVGVARTPGTPGGETGGWKNQLAVLNNYSKMLMRDAAAKLASVTITGQSQQQQQIVADADAEIKDKDGETSLTRLQKAASRMGVHNLVN